MGFPLPCWLRYFPSIEGIPCPTTLKQEDPAGGVKDPADKQIGEGEAEVDEETGRAVEDERADDDRAGVEVTDIRVELEIIDVDEDLDILLLVLEGAANGRLEIILVKSSKLIFSCHRTTSIQNYNPEC